MKKNKKSLNAIATEIEMESIDDSDNGESQVSYKTVERRFKEFVKINGLNIKELKDKKGEIYFEENEAVILKALLIESIDKNSFVYKLLKDKDDDISFNQIKSFMDNINDFMVGKISDEEREYFMSYMDQSLKYSVLMEIHNIYNIIECLNANLSTNIYGYHLNSLIELRKKLEKEFIYNSVEAVENMINLSEILSFTKEVSGEPYDYGDDAVAWEYRQRDIDFKKFLEENPLIKQHIEQKLDKSVEEIL
ncbi:hypothetical protein [Paraclostridium sordellii]|uniref:hypothetical protein n=1 Tax=Paraclostridium sordellii TaxID=1505 RepID=UPI0005E41CCB|nr:hypothetical protein [Paeniclostridium sordellii]CEN26172.1 Uncharacterised protein [[Clostridium] sordellii] [Paeniclostridium sordellii]